MPQEQRWRQAHAAFDRLATCQGVPNVRLCVGGWGSRGQTVRDKHGGFTVLLARRFVRHAAWIELIAVLAHELQHAYYGHPQARPRPATTRLLVVVSVAVGVLCALSIALVVVVLNARTAGHGWWLLPGWLAVSVLLAAVDARFRERRERRHGKCRIAEEIQADLGAARLVGKEPVLLALLGAHPVGRCHAHVIEWRERCTYWVWRTHPPRSMRIAAVRAFNFDEDPAQAARQITGLTRAE